LQRFFRDLDETGIPAIVDGSVLLGKDLNSKTGYFFEFQKNVISTSFRYDIFNDAFSIEMCHGDCNSVFFQHKGINRTQPQQEEAKAMIMVLNVQDGSEIRNS